MIWDEVRPMKIFMYDEWFEILDSKIPLLFINVL